MTHNRKKIAEPSGSSTVHLIGHEIEHIAEHSYGEENTGNLIIKGDNLSILKAIMPKLKGRIRCVYIDPPYNNKENYNHYNDKQSHERWIRDILLRIKLLAKVLSQDGSLWISIDDREVHYLKVAVDKILKRENFITTVVWQQRTSRENRKVFSNNHEYILVYSRDAQKFKASRNFMPYTSEVLSRYRNPDCDERGRWQSVSANVQAGHATPAQFYEVVAPNGSKHVPPKGRCWVYNLPRMKKEIAKNNIWFGPDGNGVPRIKRFLSEARPGLTPETLWGAIDVGSNDTAKKHLLQLFPDLSVFDTPKPEQLIYRILYIATNPGDIILDAYLGSGTTCAVAHKMGRRYIGIETGEHIITHAVHRMRQVVKGESGGISKSVRWRGGGGFDFCRLK